MMTTAAPQQDKSSELRVYQGPPAGGRSLAGRLLRHPLLYDPSRLAFNYAYPKLRMAELLARHHGRGAADRLLIAPCGTGDDVPYLAPFARRLSGIDLSRDALSQCPPALETVCADILESGYPDDSFDLVASPLFFHHLLKVGFDQYLLELLRVLRPGGGIVILEPSVYYPLNLITRPLKRILGNPLDEVPDEDPFPPGLMLRALRRTGFCGIEWEAASFSHCSFFIPMARLVNRLGQPLLRLPLFRCFGWMVLYYAEKPRDRA